VSLLIQTLKQKYKLDYKSRYLFMLKGIFPNLNIFDWYGIWIWICSLMFDVHCLTRGQMLIRAHALKSEMDLFLKMGGGWKWFHPPCNSERRYDYFVCTEITQHNELNVNLQVTVVFNEIFGKRRGFGMNLRFLELQLQSE
jgi:hypothetical protein